MKKYFSITYLLINFLIVIIITTTSLEPLYSFYEKLVFDESTYELQAEEEYQDLTNIELTNINLKKVIKQFKPVSSSTNNAQILEYLELARNKSKIKIDEIIPGKEEFENGLAFKQFKIVTKSTYEQFYNFLLYLESSDYLQIQNNVRLTKTKKSKTQLIGTIEIKFYVKK